MDLESSVAVAWGTFVMLTGIPSNLLIMHVYCKRRTRTSAHVFILGIAVSDMIGCLMLPLSMYHWMNALTFTNDNLCKATLSARFFRSYLSLFLTAALAVDRYCAVCEPEKRLELHQAATIIGVCAAIAAVVSFPSALVFGIKEDADANDFTCDILGPIWAKEVFYTFEITIHVLAIFVIIVMFFLLFAAACRYRRRAALRNALITSLSRNAHKAWSVADPENDSDMSICVTNRQSVMNNSRRGVPISSSSSSSATAAVEISLIPSYNDIDILTADVPSSRPPHQLPPVERPSHHASLPHLNLHHLPSLPSIPEIPGTVNQYIPPNVPHSRHTTTTRFDLADRCKQRGSSSDHVTETGECSRISMLSTDAGGLQGGRSRKLLSALNRMLVISTLVTLITWLPAIIVFVMPISLIEATSVKSHSLLVLITLAKHFAILNYAVKAVIYTATNQRFRNEASQCFQKIKGCIVN